MFKWFCFRDFSNTRRIFLLLILSSFRYGWYELVSVSVAVYFVYLCIRESNNKVFQEFFIIYMAEKKVHWKQKRKKEVEERKILSDLSHIIFYLRFRLFFSFLYHFWMDSGCFFCCSSIHVLSLTFFFADFVLYVRLSARSLQPCEKNKNQKKKLYIWDRERKKSHEYC